MFPGRQLASILWRYGYSCSRSKGSVEMSKGKMLAFTVISSLVGASDAFAQDCYRVHTQPGHPRVLEMRLTNDTSVPPRPYLGVSKFHLKGVESDGLLHVITVRSITGGPPATEDGSNRSFVATQQIVCLQG